MERPTTEELVHTLEVVCEDGVDDKTKHAIVELATVRIEEMANRLFNLAEALR